jgi:hypothetical protein
MDQSGNETDGEKRSNYWPNVFAFPGESKQLFKRQNEQKDINGKGWNSILGGDPEVVVMGPPRHGIQPDHCSSVVFGISPFPSSSANTKNWMVSDQFQGVEPHGSPTPVGLIFEDGGNSCNHIRLILIETLQSPIIESGGKQRKNKDNPNAGQTNRFSGIVERSQGLLDPHKNDRSESARGGR